MNDNIIEDVFDAVTEDICPNSPEYKQIVKNTFECEDKLIKSLSDNQKSLLENLMKQQSACRRLEEIELMKKCFLLAAMLLK